MNLLLRLYHRYIALDIKIMQLIALNYQKYAESKLKRVVHLLSM
jgi:hypothetical protein